ncbi:branched-chain amino acid ABC transporter permease [Xenophilus sp. Marseille-Q4582]|uniref:branched-chain amino acid ABC transporter permease n=1 Tax=Xenophilus sp. Marseille-Q4582 TaxID=2866600 RepID=UPI001CE3D97A|nr:branched-chain amino acid ABC transporter permease [Xenophilus sp. Marseille-Q4582]
MAAALLNGLLLGGMYALMSIGLTLQYGVARIMNLSYGEGLVMAAFAAWWATTHAGISPLWVSLLVVPAGFAVSVWLYRVGLHPLVRRARDRSELEVSSLLATFGFMFVFQGMMLLIFGGAYHSYTFMAWPVSLAGEIVAANRLLALGLAVAACIALYLGLTRSRWGVALRAVAADPSLAPLVGVDGPRVSALVFGVGGALVALAGVLVSLFQTFNANSGIVFTAKALVIVIMGGVGHVQGCLVAALLLGLSESLVATYVDPGLAMAVTFALFTVVLLWRPTGLFGGRTR